MSPSGVRGSAPRRKIDPFYAEIGAFCPKKAKSLVLPMATALEVAAWPATPLEADETRATPLEAADTAPKIKSQLPSKGSPTPWGMSGHAQGPFPSVFGESSQNGCGLILESLLWCSYTSKPEHVTGYQVRGNFKAKTRNLRKPLLQLSGAKEAAFYGLGTR